MQHPDLVVSAPGRAARFVWLACLCLTVLTVAGLISVHMKQDDNWDLQNYHIYNAFSLLGGRLGHDLWAGQQQITFNPLLDLPYYAAARLCLPDAPRLVAFLAGLPFGALVLVAASLNITLFGRAERGRLPLALVATVLGVCGTTVLGEIGTTFGDIPITCLVLMGVTGLVFALRDGQHWRLGCALAGVALGLAAGLKLTAALYAPAAIMALMCCRRPPGRIVSAAIFAGAWLAGFAPPFVWWGVHVQRVFASPVFPLFNSVFASPWAAATNSLDTRFLPHGVAEWLFYPAYWLRGQPFRVSEGPVRDAHFACAYLAIAAILARWIQTQARMPPERAFLLLFFATAFALWEAVFSILRYAMPLEVLTGTLVVWAADLLASARPRSWRAGAIVAAPLAMLALQSTADTGRLKRYGRTTFEIGAPPLPDRAAVAFLGRPTSFVAPFLKGLDLVFLGLGGEQAPTPVMADAMRARLRAASSVFALVNRSSDAGARSLDALGWTVDRAGCLPVVNPFQSGIFVCRADHKARQGALPLDPIKG